MCMRVCMHPGSKWKSAWQKTSEESQKGSLEPSVCMEYRIASLAPHSRGWVRVRVRPTSCNQHHSKHSREWA